MIQLRTLRKLSGTTSTINKQPVIRAPYIFEDFFTGEQFIYTQIDNSIYDRVRIGGDILVVLNKLWTRHREKLT